MKRLFGLMALLSVLLFSTWAVAGGCGGLAGECYAPDENNTGYIGNSTYKWGNGYFGTVDIDTLTVDTITVNTTRTFPSRTLRTAVPLGGLFVDGTGPITNATAPNLTTVDNVAAVVYDNSTEVAEIQFSWVPDPTMTAMAVKILATSSDASGADISVDWSIFVHNADTNIATVVAQTHATFDSATMDVSNDLVTLTMDATGIAAITAASSAVTIAVWNQGTASSETLEIKAIWIEETVTN